MNALDIIRKAEQISCGCEGDYIAWCDICSRSTCHAGEHSGAQLLAYANGCRSLDVDAKALAVALTLGAWYDNTWKVRG